MGAPEDNSRDDLTQPLTVEEFSALLSSGFGQALCGASAVAVGLSGGPDSMALTRLLSLVAEKNPGSPDIHALTVDHGLRAESAAEAAQVHEWVAGWTGVEHHILKWKEKPESRIQEEARFARYELMAGYCRERGISHLFLAHHRDDQAETFLFRLAKGSGLDGLSGMKPVQGYGGLTLLRPFLDIPKSRLLASCAEMGIPFVQDPSNESENFARIRLRQSAGILAEEGLSAKRLATTARRLERARVALDEMAEKALEEITLEKDTNRIVLNSETYGKLAEELALRVLLKVIKTFRPEEDYAPRLEKIEDLLGDLRAENPFRKRTLGGVVFERNDKQGQIILCCE